MDGGSNNVTFLDQDKHDYVQAQTVELAERLISETGLPLRTVLLHIYSACVLYGFDQSAYVGRDVCEAIEEANTTSLKHIRHILKTVYEPVEDELAGDT